MKLIKRDHLHEFGKDDDPGGVWCNISESGLSGMVEIVDQKVVTPTSDNVEWCTSPELYLQVVGSYKEEIAKGRAALEAASAQSITFYYAGEPEGAGFICPLEEGQEEVARYTEEEGGEPEPFGFDPMNYEITWQGPHLTVTPHGAMLRWDSKHGDGQLWVTVHES